MNSVLKPNEILSQGINVAQKKANGPTLKLIVLGILAGFFIAIGAYASNMVIHTFGTNSFGLMKFVQGAIFPVGLILVVVAGAELFTGNVLIYLGVLSKKVTLKQMFRNWTLVYIGNFIGSVLFALLIYYSGLLKVSNGQLGVLHINIAMKKVHLSLGNIFIRGILANILVCLAVWMAFGCKTMIGKVLACWFPVMTFVAAGFEHSIANMYYIPMGILSKNGFSTVSALSAEQLSSLNWNAFLYNLIPSTLGNIIGGILIAGSYWYLYSSKEKEHKIGRGNEKDYNYR